METLNDIRLKTPANFNMINISEKIKDDNDKNSKDNKDKKEKTPEVVVVL